MKTITFYSYKGGVGRTLSLVNIANLLEEFGKKVCIIDFDLEAPGLDQKFKDHIEGDIKDGLVDYIYEFASKNQLPQSIKLYSITIQNMDNNKILIPAGNTSKKEYWNKLSHISWWDLFYEKDSEGIPFFLDLKEKIKNEINPDYLLIDTRTGITEISGITMSLLADSIVLFAANNPENIRGIQQIIRSIIREENNLLNTNKEIHFALTRIPLPQTPQDKTFEEEIENLRRKEIEEAFEDKNHGLRSFNLIHSDRDTELFEKNSMSYRLNRKKSEIKSSIIPEYLALFESLISDDLVGDEKCRFSNFISAKRLLSSIYSNPTQNHLHIDEKLDIINKWLPESPDSTFLRGYFTYYQKKDYPNAEKFFRKGIKKDESGKCTFFYAESLFRQKKYKEAIIQLDSYLKKGYHEYRPNANRDLIISKVHLKEDHTILMTEVNRLIEKYPFFSSFYNIRSCLHLKVKEFEAATRDIFMAIKLEPDSLYYTTLAEIRLSQGNKLEFYMQMDTALELGYDIENILSEPEFSRLIFDEMADDNEFISILNRYNKGYFIDLLREKFNR